MTDQGLTELAAKAAGIELKYNSIGSQDARCPWNPLENDGDALRLAVQLGIAIIPYPVFEKPKHSVIAKQYIKSELLREENSTQVIELYGSDPDAATRRVIVKAAAKIGENGNDFV